MELPPVPLAPRRPFYEISKRGFDIGVSALLLALLAPLWLLLALAIKLTSAGPIFYRWQVVGLGGRPFTGYKFRTMVVNADALKDQLLAANEMSGPVFKIKRDPRITPVGRFLRKLSLDELPQLWSVLKGDMSLVGPRPYIERELPDMNGQEKIILRATPGMTGMWQVSDRNAASFAWRVQVDVHYVRNWSPWLDMYILAKTIGVVLKGSGV